jgi:putative phosphoribosyl transferase
MLKTNKFQPKNVIIEAQGESLILGGFLTIPNNAKGLVIFAHGSGSSRYSPRNQFIANVFCETYLASLLIDLLTPDEEKIDLQTRHLRFDIKLLADRLNFATNWVKKQMDLSHLKMGYIGSSTGAAAALAAAAQHQEDISAVVSRGGRADLAGEALSLVKAPTLLIVGGEDYDVIKLNEMAYEKLTCLKKIEIVPRATHLFEEVGTLEIAADMAKKWFLKYLK